MLSKYSLSLSLSLSISLLLSLSFFLLYYSVKPNYAMQRREKIIGLMTTVLSLVVLFFVIAALVVVVCYRLIYRSLDSDFAIRNRITDSAETY